VVQVVKHFHRKHKALNSNPTAAQRKRKRKKEENIFLEV
jgi:hypothetical protein